MDFLPPRREDRFIRLEAGEAKDPISVSNEVHASKHSLLTFLPFALLDRLLRLSSLWFLLVILFEVIPLTDSDPPSYSSAALFALHVLLNVSKSIVAMYRCRVGEASINAQLQEVWRGGRFETLQCDKLRVGDCVVITEKLRVPADIVLLATSAKNGASYVSMIRTYGESSLEMKTAIRQTQRMLHNESSPGSFNFDRLDASLTVESPSSDFLSFSGTIKLRHFPRSVPLKPDNFVLRGALLQGQDWVLGLILYTGMETKYWSNLAHPAKRATFIERMLNRWIVLAGAVAVVGAGIGLGLQYCESNSGLEALDFVRYLGLYTGLVPLGMYVAIDILRVVHALRMGGERSAVNAHCMVESFGKVRYVLADKTGTVTSNKLELLAVLIGSQLYSKDPILASGQSLDDSSSSSLVLDPEKAFSFHDLQTQLMHRSAASEVLRRFCECVVLCNSVIPLQDGTFRGTSVDEEALIQGATELGFTLCERRSEHITVLIFDECVFYEMICMKKFSTEVRRMRVLVKQEVSPRTATLFVKGSYPALANMLNLSHADRNTLERELELMSNKGLRTMVMCYRIISGEYLAEIETRVRRIKASCSRGNIEGNLEVLFMELEQNLTYLGVSGVREHLQAEAIDTVETLKAAGVATWLLSGEGEAQTLACAKGIGLLSGRTPVVSLTGMRRTEDCKVRFIEAVNTILLQDSHMTESSMITPGNDSNPPLIPANFAIAVDGETLNTAIKSEETQRTLISLLLSASAVCLTTMHPSHKREAVQLLREAVRAGILVIGDSVSDIPMLLEADISIGCKGDKTEAISDATAVFSELRSLILWQGRAVRRQLTRGTLLFLYSAVFVTLATCAMTTLADFTPANVVAEEGRVVFGAVFVFLPIVALVSLPEHCEPTVHESRTSLWKSLRTYCVLAVTQFAVMSGLLLAACFDGSATDVTEEQLSFLYLASIVKVVCVQCFMESSRLWGVHLAVQLLASGTVYIYYSLSVDGAAVVASVFATPRLVLGMAGTVLACCALSVAYTSASQLQSLSSKVQPVDFHNSDLKPITRHSKSLQTMFTHRGFEQCKSALDRYSISKGAFANAQTERGFQIAFEMGNVGLYWVQLGIVFVQALVPFLIEVAGSDLSSVRFSIKSTLVTGVCLTILGSALRRIAHWSAQLFALVLIASTFILNLTLSGLNAYIFFYVTVCLLLFLREKWLANIAIAGTASVLLVCSIGVALSRDTGMPVEEGVSAVGTIVVQMFTLTVAGKTALRKATLVREQFRLVEESKAKIEQSDTILGYLLPEFICNRVKDGLRYAAEDQDEVSVLFIDICDFDSICSNYFPPELIALLDDIFQRIDELCSSLQVAKIETVGKTYLACAGIRDFEFEETGEYSSIPHAKRALDLAFAVLRNFKSTKLISERPLSFKIGIDSGPVIAGVVGYHKPQFVIVGDTVNTASRMASSLSSCDSIQITSSTYDLLQDRPEFEFQQHEVYVKGKGLMTTYTVGVAAEDVFGLEPISRQQSTRWNRRQRSSLAEHMEIVAEEPGRNWRNVWCRESEEEKTFRIEHQKEAVGVGRLGLVQFTAGFIGLFTIRAATMQVSPWDLIATTLYISLSLGGGGMLFCQKKIYDRLWFPWGVGLLYCGGSLLIAVDTESFPALTADLTSIIVGLFLVLVNFASGLMFRSAILGTLGVISGHLWTISGSEQAERAVFYMIFALQCCVLVFATERSQRLFHQEAKFAKREIEKTEQLLTQMIPVQAYEGLREGQWSTDRLNDVAILFADVSGFTSWSSVHSPALVIDKLSTIFTMFDKICVRRKLFKVCTIGDCYVALSSTSNSETRNPGEECARMVKFALEMVQVLDDICREDGDGLHMRIGVHVGEVVAGITGSRIVRYDIYGPDVVLANKMESSGAVSRVNVSDRAKSLLEHTYKGEFGFEFNKRVESPEIDRSAETYFVSYLSAESSPPADSFRLEPPKL